MKFILLRFACTKSKNKLAIRVATLIEVPLGQPYCPEHEVGMISAEY